MCAAERIPVTYPLFVGTRKLTVLCAQLVKLPPPPLGPGGPVGWALIVATITKLLSWFAVTSIRVLTQTPTINAELQDAERQAYKFRKIRAFQSTRKWHTKWPTEMKNAPEGAFLLGHWRARRYQIANRLNPPRASRSSSWGQVHHSKCGYRFLVRQCN